MKERKRKRPERREETHPAAPKAEWARECLSIFPDGLERESILGSEARFLSALKEIPCFLLRVGTDSRSREIGSSRRMRGGSRARARRMKLKRVGREARRKEGRAAANGEIRGRRGGGDGGKRAAKEGRK